MAHRKQVYKITYPNGKVYVGMDLTATLTYFGSPSPKAKGRIVADLDAQRLDLTVRKEILWESETASDAQVRAMEIRLIGIRVPTTQKWATTCPRVGWGSAAQRGSTSPLVGYSVLTPVSRNGAGAG